MPMNADFVIQFSVLWPVVWLGRKYLSLPKATLQEYRRCLQRDDGFAERRTSPLQ